MNMGSPQADELGRQPCTMGVGCEEAGVCYASAFGQSEQCDRSPPAPAADGAGEHVATLKHILKHHYDYPGTFSIERAALRAAIVSLRQPVSSITDEMVERACMKYAFREDGALWPDDYSPHEVAAERVLMREFLTHVIAPLQISSSVSAPEWSPTPPTKDGWYWMKERFRPAKVIEVSQGLGYEPRYPDEPFDVEEATETLGILWYGPLQEPA